ncbi:MAG: hypothetical protein ACR2OC_09665 [Solirubrobacterales bacterium]
MRRAVASTAFVAMLALLAAAPASGADVLSIGKASKETKELAERDCRRDSDCKVADAANCRRLASRRVSCVASNVGTDKKGDYQCDRLVIVRLSDDGDLKRAAGDPSCYRI